MDGNITHRLQHLLSHAVMTPDQQRQVFQDIHAEVLSQSSHMREPNFRAFHADDLAYMFQLYDQRVFQGACSQALQGRPLTFHLSSRMTRAGGRTTWKTTRQRHSPVVHEEFSVTVSSHLLFQTFRDEQRSVTVTGLVCHNRLQAMQRIVEHEIVHLGERLAWNESNCAARRFQSIARRLFGHQAHTHDLVTTSEVARQQHGIRRGSRVSFEYDGCRYEGVVNRITKRVTVLVPDDEGIRYSDGKRYRKFYIPLQMLQNSDDPHTSPDSISLP